MPYIAIPHVELLGEFEDILEGHSLGLQKQLFLNTQLFLTNSLIVTSFTPIISEGFRTYSSANPRRWAVPFSNSVAAWVITLFASVAVGDWISGEHYISAKCHSPPVFGRGAAVHGNEKKRDHPCAKRIKHFQLNAPPAPTALGLLFLSPEGNKEFEDGPFSSVPSGPDVLRIGVRCCTHGEDHL